jgi:hypothetical protein
MSGKQYLKPELTDGLIDNVPGLEILSTTRDNKTEKPLTKDQLNAIKEHGGKLPICNMWGLYCSGDGTVPDERCYQSIDMIGLCSTATYGR